MMKTNKDFDLAYYIMNALWVEELDIDDENILSRILKKMDIDSQTRKIKLGRAKNAIEDFIHECFNSNGDIKNPKTPKPLQNGRVISALIKQKKNYVERV